MAREIRYIKYRFVHINTLAAKPTLDFNIELVIGEAISRTANRNASNDKALKLVEFTISVVNST